MDYPARAQGARHAALGWCRALTAQEITFMRYRALLMIALALTGLPTIAQYKFGSKDHPDRPWRKTVAGLGVWLSVTTTPGSELVDQFDSPKPNSMLVIHEATKVNRNQDFTIFMLFQNCSKDSSGRCNVTATFSLI